MSKKTFERRMSVTGLEVREGSGTLSLSGYASTFGQPYDMGWYTESVDVDAFKRTLGQKPDVRLLINHAGLPLARTTSGTLSLDTDKHGLIVSAELDPSDPDVASLAPKMKRGDLNQMSFAFRTTEDIWENDMTKRTLLSLDLADGDVSVVTYPANPNATASIRAGGPSVDGIFSALRALETRGAPSEDIASVLTRALAYFSAVDLIVDEAQEDISEALNIPNPDDEADDMPMSMNAAAVSHELRARLLRVAG
jgi:HK97 family phage prohead protease